MEGLGDYTSNDVFGGILAQVSDQRDGIRSEVRGKIHLSQMRDQLVLENCPAKSDTQTDTTGSQEGVHDCSVRDFLAVRPNLDAIVQGHEEETISNAGRNEDQNPAVVLNVGVEQHDQTGREDCHSPARPDRPAELSESAHDQTRNHAHRYQGAASWNETETGLKGPESFDGFKVNGEVVECAEQL